MSDWWVEMQNQHPLPGKQNSTVSIVSIYVKPPLNKARKEMLMPFTWKKRNEEKKKILRQSHVKFGS